MKRKLIARAWVLTHGRDCDGMTCRGISAFTTLKDAKKSAEENAEWSDGAYFSVTEKWSEVVEYINDTSNDVDFDIRYYSYTINY